MMVIAHKRYLVQFLTASRTVLLSLDLARQRQIANRPRRLALSFPHAPLLIQALLVSFTLLVPMNGVSNSLSLKMSLSCCGSEAKEGDATFGPLHVDEGCDDRKPVEAVRQDCTH